LMNQDVLALERATERLVQTTSGTVAGLVEAIAARGQAVQQLSLRQLQPDEAERVRLAIERGNRVAEQIRSLRAEWRADLERVTQAQQYCTELGRGVTPVPRRIDIAG
jgi:hypothetical protein